MTWVARLGQLILCERRLWWDLGSCRFWLASLPTIRTGAPDEMLQTYHKSLACHTTQLTDLLHGDDDRMS